MSLIRLVVAAVSQKYIVIFAIVRYFNIHVDNTNDALGLAFKELINSFGVKQNVTGPTHRFNNMLDLIISILLI